MKVIFHFFTTMKVNMSPNVPDVSQYRMQHHRDFILDLALSYKPMPYYVIKEGVRVPRPGMNMTPTFTLGYRKAIPAEGFETDFDLVTLGVKQLLKTGRESKIEYAVDDGVF